MSTKNSLLITGVLLLAMSLGAYSLQQPYIGIILTTVGGGLIALSTVD